MTLVYAENMLTSFIDQIISQKYNPEWYGLSLYIRMKKPVENV